MRPCAYRNGRRVEQPSMDTGDTGELQFATEAARSLIAPFHRAGSDVFSVTAERPYAVDGGVELALALAAVSARGLSVSLNSCSQP